MDTWDDALLKRGGTFLPSDGGGGSEQAMVLECGDVLLQLHPDLGGVQGDRSQLGKRGTKPPIIKLN